MCGLFLILEHELLAFLTRNLSHFASRWLSSHAFLWCAKKDGSACAAHGEFMWPPNNEHAMTLMAVYTECRIICTRWNFGTVPLNAEKRIEKQTKPATTRHAFFSTKNAPLTLRVIVQCQLVYMGDPSKLVQPGKRYCGHGWFSYETGGAINNSQLKYEASPLNMCISRMFMHGAVISVIVIYMITWRSFEFRASLTLWTLSHAFNKNENIFMATTSWQNRMNQTTVLFSLQDICIPILWLPLATVFSLRGIWSKNDVSFGLNGFFHLQPCN